MQEQRRSPRAEERRPQPPPKDAQVTEEGGEEHIHLLQSKVEDRPDSALPSVLPDWGGGVFSGVELRRSPAEGRVASLH